MTLFLVGLMRMEWATSLMLFFLTDLLPMFHDAVPIKLEELALIPAKVSETVPTTSRIQWHPVLDNTWFWNSSDLLLHQIVAILLSLQELLKESSTLLDLSQEDFSGHTRLSSTVQEPM